MAKKKSKYYFENDLVAKIFDTKEVKIQLKEDLRAMTAFGIVVAPKGLISDFSSIPKWIRWLIPKMGRQNRSSVIHDSLYKYGRRIWNDPSTKISQEVADLIYKKLMEHRKVALWNRWAQWKGLRIGGSKQWNIYRKEDAKLFSHEVDPCR